MTNIHDTMMETSCIRTRDIAWRNSDTRLLQQLLFFRLHNDYVPQSKLVSILYLTKILIAWFFEEETYQHLRTPRADSVAAHQARLGIVARQAAMPLFPIPAAHRTLMKREARGLTNVALIKFHVYSSSSYWSKQYYLDNVMHCLCIQQANLNRIGWDFPIVGK